MGTTQRGSIEVPQGYIGFKVGGFLKLGDTFSEVNIIRTLVYCVLHWGSPI